ncbi:MAG: hypothetical protein AAGB35_04610 [Pseudomonadota bacterium]
MTSKSTALILGGFLPAIIYGGSALLQKTSTSLGISLSAYLVATGVGVAIVGICFYFIDHTFSFSAKSGLYACAFGLTWGIASGLVAHTLLNYDVPISQLVPLYNMNTLIAVLLALIVFSEWKDLHTIKLLSGSVLIVAGAILVANA